jgi:hypothetical protein
LPRAFPPPPNLLSPTPEKKKKEEEEERRSVFQKDVSDSEGFRRIYESANNIHAF